MKTVLTHNQQVFIEELKKNPYLVKNFYLTGGTALAEFYLRHRISEDLDFFTQKDFNPGDIDLFINKLQKKLKATDVYRQKIYDRYVYNFQFKKEILKAEFVKYEFQNLKPLKNFNGLLVNDIFDIAVGKFYALFDRNELKDFVDLYFLLKKYKLERLITGVKQKYGFKLDPINIGGELIKIKTAEKMPKMIIPVTQKELIDFYHDQAYQLKNKIFIS